MSSIWESGGYISPVAGSIADIQQWKCSSIPLGGRRDCKSTHSLVNQLDEPMSGICLFGHFEGIVNFYSKVAHGTFKLCVSK